MGRGDATSIVGRIKVPVGAGRLEPAREHMNGPSGRALDEHFLGPLGIGRADAWLCDLVPHTCRNAGQARALAREYEPRAKRFGLASVDLPAVPKKFGDAARREEVLRELEESRAELVVLLGDLTAPTRAIARAPKLPAQPPQLHGEFAGRTYFGVPFLRSYLQRKRRRRSAGAACSTTSRAATPCW